MPLVIAHRGSHERVPENTLEAFAAAAEHGAEMIEFDVRRTADGALAVFHDPEIARTPLNRLTLEELRQHAGIEVPVLEDVLAWATDAGMGLDVELKEDDSVDRIASLLNAHDGPLLVTSFIDPVVARLAELAPQVPSGLLLSLTARGAVRRVEQCGARAAVIEMKLLTPRVLDELAAAGLAAYVWDFLPTRLGHAEWLADERIAGFITDDVPGTLAGLT
jgi:glycerophosphoryl diester phosphodiesterase